MTKSPICCLFRKFSTQSGLTDLQHASLEDKVWFDCLKFIWHRLRFYILASLCLFEYSIVSHQNCPGGVQVLILTFYRLVRPFPALRQSSKNVFSNHQTFPVGHCPKTIGNSVMTLKFPFFSNFPTKLPTQAGTSQLPSQPRPCRQFCASGPPKASIN